MTMKRWSAMLVAASMTVALSACGGEDDAETTPTPTQAVEPEEATEPEETEEVEATEEETEAEETTEATEDATQETDDVEETEDSDDQETGGTAGGEGDDELTEPGAELAIGDAAVIQMASNADPQDPSYRYLKLRATVTEIEEADPSLLDGVTLATPVEDEVPFLIWADLEILDTEGDYDITDYYPQFNARHADGSRAMTIFTSSGSIGECESEYYDSLEPGSTARLCIVALADAGQEIGQVLWGGNDNADGEGDWQNNPYYEDPIVWID
ncbi:lipoprotein [Ornithinimicrobium sp. Y1847]|uniref:LptM family lipoprotein n=1 Tax=Ornithinimicrobium sp. Y1847 TaxID=3405419 RepID=UPI003B66BE87